MAMAVLVVILTLCSIILPESNAALTTRTANAAFRKQVLAEKTCGSPPEKYYEVSQTDYPPRLRTQSICNSSNPTDSHKPSNLVDGDFNTFWQSTAMVNRANITIDLTGPIHKYYYIDGIEIYFQEFYRPLQMALYKSSDNGVTYSHWHYYVSSENSDTTPSSQCEEKFHMKLGSKPAFENDVICQAYPNVTAKRNNDIVSWNPSFLRGEDINPSNKLVDWINVTNIRIDFITLNKPFDPLAVQWYHYAVKEILVNAYCPCNGHGIGCEYNKTVGDNQCKCQLGTCGYMCDKCCPAYNQYPWKRGGKGPMVVDESSACQLCNCHNHSSVCVYNQTVADRKASLTVDGKYSGGGVCQDCQDNTEGINCEKCKPLYYHPANRSRYAGNTCEECQCFRAGCRNVSGVLFLDCLRELPAVLSLQNQTVGNCYCKNNTMGRICNKCKPGYYNLTASNPDGCQVCLCNEAGSVNRSNVCEPDANGQCPCKLNVHGVRCDTCNDTFYGLSQSNDLGCKDCMCNKGGSAGPICNKQTGKCPCLPNIDGRQCDIPKDEAYFPGLHFIGSDQASTGSPWVTSFNVTKTSRAVSGLFTLILQYQSTSSQYVTIIVTTTTSTLREDVILNKSIKLSSRNLSEFGEVTLSDVVKVRINFTDGFQGRKIIALPKEFYEPALLRQDILSNEAMNKYLTNCSVLNNDVKNGTALEQFCKQSVFTITAAYLGKALECNCNPTGSINLICEKYGGQCSCKPGVTGRQCDQCLPRFYNFTSTGCTACGCMTDNKVCDTVTGQCDCPPNTRGRVCGQCNSTFWGWNSTTGCKACNCDATGSSSLQCNLTNGVCSCKAGVHLDKCTECQDGFKNFSTQGCKLCGCDMRGSINPTCNKTTGQCPCKNNSISMTCNQCRPGSFYLFGPHPKGCTDCICMGITRNCSSTNKNIFQRPLESSLWDLYDEDAKKSVPTEKSVMSSGHENIAFVTANVSSAAQKLIWRANSNLTQKSLVSSYGGNLSFALHITNLSSASSVSSPKVIIKGSHGVSIEQGFTPVSVDEIATRVVYMKETSWVYSGTSSPVSRAHFMLLLAKPLAVHVTASLLSGGDGYYKTSFGGVSVADVQGPATSQGRALDVEQCQCGPEYTGLSCERCAASHHRVNETGDSFFGKCAKCDCNHHTLDCYASTGQCYNCDHNTTSDHCERCVDGFYGNATDGTPKDCKTCPCDAPRTTTSLCTDYYGLPKCTNCSVGYEGRLCNKCQLKYFGKPHQPGGNCSLCRCSNNSEICDRITGECQGCKYNTTGFHCERCRNETYGYAPRQNCTACNCDAVGSKHNVCDHRSGKCVCQPNVDTRNCSKCMHKSYNFTKSGCTECKCNTFGSTNLQCNESGVCECKTHALGDKCDRCERDFYGLPKASCKACNCNATGSNTSIPCDGVTGQCHCKPGVTGRQCDRCMVMHVNFTSDGCDPCPECARLGLQGTLNRTQLTLESSLKKSKQVEKLKPFKEQLNQVYDRIKVTESLVAEFNKRINDLQKGLKDLKSNTLNTSIHELRTRLSSMSEYAHKLKQNTTQALEKVLSIENKTEKALNTVKDVNSLTSSIEKQLRDLKDSTTDLLSKANTVLKYTYIDETTKVNAELAKARYTKDSLVKFARDNVTDHKTRADALNASMSSDQTSYHNKLDEFSSLSKQNEVITGINLEVNLLVKQTLNLISQANTTLVATHVSLNHAKSSLSAAWVDISSGRTAYQEADQVMNRKTGLKEKLPALRTSITDTQTLIRSTNNSVNINATNHAANLTAEAKLRKSEMDSVQDNAKRAVAAIKQYESVVKLVNQSLETSVKVNESLHEIIKKLKNFSVTFSDIDTKAKESLKKSETLLKKTQARTIDFASLQANVSKANQTLLKSTQMGKQIDRYHSILLSKTSKLVAMNEPHASEHSVFKDTRKAESYAAYVKRRTPSIWIYAETAQQEVDRLNSSVRYINSAAEHARELMPKAFTAASRAHDVLQNVTTSANQALAQRNKTTELRSTLTSNMERLKEKLQKAKENIAKIQHALKVQGNTSLEYAPSGRVVKATSFSDISLDLKADRIQGPLLYLAEGLNAPGNQISLALTLVAGEFVKFTYNLGSGPVSIINYAVPILKGTWYRVYASRYRERARLTVTNYFTNYSRTYESSSNLILPRKNTNFTSDSPMFLAGLPEGAMMNQTRRFFYGCIDNVVINQQSLDLWRPSKVVGRRYACSKCFESGKPGLDDVISCTSFYGNPNTFIVHNMGTFNISHESQMVFQFRTFQSNASIVNVQGDEAYVYGVYIKSGRIAFYFKNGSVTHTLFSNKASYGDGRWNEVHVKRGLINSTLTVKVVGSEITDSASLTVNASLALPSGLKLVFGGRNPKSSFDVPVNSQLAGAIRNVSLSGSAGAQVVHRNLNDKALLEGSDQVDLCGCLRNVESCIRFHGNGVATINTGITNMTSLSLKFKTLNPSGVLVFGGDTSKNFFFYLVLFHGNLYLVNTNKPNTDPEPVSTSTQTLNDGAYHTVDIELAGDRLKVTLDSNPVSTLLPSGPVPLSNGKLYIGGLPSPNNIPFDIPVIESFVGGMKYVRVNQRNQNIFSGTSNRVSLAGCSRERNVIPTAKPTIPPLPPSCGARHPQLRTSAAADQVRLGPEPMYVGFNLPRSVLNYLQHQMVVTLTFRSLSPYGVLLYTADNMKSPSQFLSLELFNGSIVFSFNTGQNLVRVQSQSSNYSNGVWEKVHGIRIDQFGALLVARTRDYGNKHPPPSNRSLNINSPIYLGGVPKGTNTSQMLAKYKNGEAISFYGCMSTLEISSQNETQVKNPKKDFDPDNTSMKNRSCYNSVQAQAAFSGHSYILLYKNYKLPETLDILLSFRTYERSGLLIVLTNNTGRGAITLEQLQGQIVLRFTSETNQTTLRWTDPDALTAGKYNTSFDLCDNKFHKIRVHRRGSSVTLSVDEDKNQDKNKYIKSFTVEENFSLTGKFFLGGVPDGLGYTSHIGLSKRRLEGCIEGLRVNLKNIDIVRDNVEQKEIQPACRRAA